MSAGTLRLRKEGKLADVIGEDVKPGRNVKPETLTGPVDSSDTAAIADAPTPTARKTRKKETA